MKSSVHIERRGGSSLPGQAGGVRVYDEGVYKGLFKEIDIIGSNINAEPVSTERIAIYSPPTVLSPYYNQGSATVPDIATTLRNVAAPISEGNPYKIGSWTAGNAYPCTNASTWTYSTPVACRFENTTSTIEAKVIDADGSTVLAQHITDPISGNIDVTVNNIRIRVTNWATEGIRYKAQIHVTFYMSSILSAGGRVSIQIIHHNGGTDYIKSQSNVFYDVNPFSATVDTPSITETPGGVVIKYLSGVPYYTLGSQFTVNINDIDYTNANSYIANSLVEVTGSDYGLAALTLGNTHLNGWTVLYNNQDNSYQKTDWAITATNYRAITTGARIRARAKDWVDQAWVYSSANAVLIDTWGQESTELAEYFTDEAFRRKSDDSIWDSTEDLHDVESGIHAQVTNGVLQVPNTDYTIYKPTNTRDYRDLSSGRNYYRRFTDVTRQVRSSCSFHISGFTLDDLVNSRIELWVLIPGKWGGWCYAHTPELFNFGTFDGNNDPIRLASSTSNRIDVSFGTLGLDSVYNYFRIRLVIQDASIKPDSIVVTW